MYVNRINELEYKYINEVLKSEFKNSKNTQMASRFEKRFSEIYNRNYTIMVDSGTAALHCAVAALGISRGDEVIVPAFTMASTSFAVMYESGIPIFADIDEKTFCIDPKSIEKLITPKTKAIIAVSIYGNSPDYDSILNICKKYNLKLIEDNAQCYLGYYKNKLVGTFGDISCFSLQASKHITSGEGGIVTTDDEELADNIRKFSVLGYDIVRAKSGKITKDVLQSPDYARHLSFGYKYKISDLNAAVALGQLENIERLVEARQKVAKKFKEVIKNCNWLTPQYTPKENINSYYTFAVKLEAEKVNFSWKEFRKKFIELGGDGIYAAWLPTYKEPIWKLSNDFRVLDVLKRYSGYENFISTNIKNCQNIEKIQPAIFQFKTNYLDDNRLSNQVEVLKKTIAHFDKRLNN
jgi:perosamine synthetase